jgi:ABC-type branched-subunit amino acid transport system substrate-binding protein
VISFRRARLRTAFVLVAAAMALAGCSLTGRSERPQPLPAPAPIVVPAPPPQAVAPAPAPVPANGKIQVALVLPLSGANAPIGQALLNAAQMALFDSGSDQLELLVRDSGGTAATAAASVHSAIDAGARLILGPLLAAEVEAAKPVAADAHVPMIAFSNTFSLAGGGAWLLGFDPRQEVERVVVYAHAHGRNNFAALAPSSPYGDIAVAALRQAAQLAGASVGTVSRYDPAAGNFASPVQEFASAANGSDAVLIPEGGARLRTIAPLLAFNGVDPDKVKFLGTGLWADQSLGAEPSLEGGWYAAPAPDARADFETRYKALYQQSPPFLATLGYDAMALAAVLAKAQPGGNFSVDALTNPNGFAGLNGIFRLRTDGIAERGLAVLEVHRSGSTVADPAPQSFAKPGL